MCPDYIRQLTNDETKINYDKRGLSVINDPLSNNT